MLDRTDIDGLADELDTARTTKRTIRQPSLRHPEMTLDDAYAVQRAWTERLARAHLIVGRKIGLTSKPMQRAMGIEEPDFGVITEDMVFASGGEVPFDTFIYPRVEIELAYVLASGLSGPDITVAQVLDATSHIAPSIEILDSRVDMVDAPSGHRRTIVDTVADNAADAGLIVGPGAVRPWSLDPRGTSGVLYINGVVEETGVATAVLGNPAIGVAWLARRLSAFGEGLAAGETILSGSLIQSIPVARGDVVHADFSSLGAVTCRFV
jgi:2-oxo-hept-3-ene-1,7-dioate hydratase